jgi:hypothetical protein
MTVARPIPLRASRRVAVGLGQRFSEGSASSARTFSGILGKYFRTKNSSRSHAGPTRGGFLDPGRPASAPLVSARSDPALIKAIADFCCERPAAVAPRSDWR